MNVSLCFLLLLFLTYVLFVGRLGDIYLMWAFSQCLKADIKLKNEKRTVKNAQACGCSETPVGFPRADSCGGEFLNIVFDCPVLVLMIPQDTCSLRQPGAVSSAAC